MYAKSCFCERVYFVIGLRDCSTKMVVWLPATEQFLLYFKLKNIEVQCQFFENYARL